MRYALVRCSNRPWNRIICGCGRVSSRRLVVVVGSCVCYSYEAIRVRNAWMHTCDPHSVVYAVYACVRLKLGGRHETRQTHKHLQVHIKGCEWKIIRIYYVLDVRYYIQCSNMWLRCDSPPTTWSMYSILVQNMSDTRANTWCGTRHMCAIASVEKSIFILPAIFVGSCERT